MREETTLTLRLPVELKDELMRVAKENDRSIGAQVRHTLTRAYLVERTHASEAPASATG